MILLMLKKHLSQALAKFAYQGEATTNRRTSRGVKVPDNPRSPLWILFRTTIRSVTAPGRQTDNRHGAERTKVLLATLLLFTAHIPLCFYGRRYGESRPFLFYRFPWGFVAARAVREGRAQKGCRSCGENVPDPNAPVLSTLKKT